MAATTAPPAYVAAPAPQPISQHQSITVQPAPTNSQPRSGYWKGMLWTGIIQVILGSLTVILGIVTAAALGVYSNGYYYYAPIVKSDFGSPIWCGLLFYVLAGILGILSWWKKKAGMAVGYMIMSILACLSSGVVIGLAAGRMSIFSRLCHPIYIRYRYSYGYSYGYRYSESYYDNPPSYCDLKTVYGVYGVLIILAVAEFVFSIIGASLTCRPVCSSGKGNQTVIQYHAQPHAMITTNPQGQVFYNVPTGQQQFAYPPQIGQYPQAQAPSTGYPVQQGYPQAEAPPMGEQQHHQEPEK